jgi:ABC-type multidrug transport system fused ATPase/permease subunit
MYYLTLAQLVLLVGFFITALILVVLSSIQETRRLQKARTEYYRAHAMLNDEQLSILKLRRIHPTLTQEEAEYLIKMPPVQNTLL